MASVNTPIGRIEWEGTDADLREDTTVTVVTTVNGSAMTQDMPLSRLIAMTNGAVIQYLP